MKVLFVTLDIYENVGGIERYNRNVIECLATRDEVSRAVILSLWDKDINNKSPRNNVCFRGLNRNKIKLLKEFIFHLILFRPNVIIYGHILLSPLAVIARMLVRNSRQYTIIYGIEVWSKKFIPPGYKPTSHFVVWLAKTFCDHFISVSEFTIKAAMDAYDIPGEKCFLLPCSIGLWRENIEEPQKKTSRGHILLTVARLDAYKGVDKVIRALPAIISEFPDVEYWIIGDGPFRQEYQRLAERLEVDQYVRFMGKVDDQVLSRIYREASLFVMPSSGEGFGIVFLEAWQRALPVIAGNADASAETIGTCGIIVEVDNIQSIADAVKRLLSDEVLSQTLGKKGYDRLINHFTLDKFCDTLFQIMSPPQKAEHYEPKAGR